MLIGCARRRAGGFTLVEMMVSIVIGLILTAAVTGLVLANLRTSNSSVRGMRVTEESRALTEIITRELRRARYDGQALKYLGSGATGTTFASLVTVPSNTNVTSTKDCIKFSYDANNNGTADSGEFRMFSRGTATNGRGVVKYGRFANAAAVDCTQGTIISSDDIDVSCLNFVKVTTDTAITSSNVDACFSPVPATAVSLPTIPAGSIYFSMRMSVTTGALSTAITTSRRTDGVVMIRAPTI